MKREQKRTFFDVIEKKIDPEQPRAKELRILAFGQAQNYVENLIDSNIDDCSVDEALDEMIRRTNEESGKFAENFMGDVERIVELGIKALKAELEKKIGAFETKKEDE
jgi:hypothetical protein